MNTNSTNVSSESNNENADLKKIYIMFGIFAFLLIVWVVYTLVTKDRGSTGTNYCEFDNQQYNIGDVFNVECNTCVCTQGGISCTFKICDQKCIDSNSQCKGRDDGSLCILGVWCDESGKACGGELCTDLGLGICIKEKCAGE